MFLILILAFQEAPKGKAKSSTSPMVDAPFSNVSTTAMVGPTHPRACAATSAAACAAGLRRRFCRARRGRLELLDGGVDNDQ